MSREDDLHWYQANRQVLADKYDGAWLVVLERTIVGIFYKEEEAVDFSVRRYGLNVASVFQAVMEDPLTFA